jgi:hypothetical protein
MLKGRGTWSERGDKADSWASSLRWNHYIGGLLMNTNRNLLTVLTTSLCLAALLLVAGTPATAGLLGIGFGDNNLYDISTGSGVASNPRHVLDKVNTIAYAPSGILYGVSQGFPTDVPAGGKLYTIDPGSGFPTYVADLDVFVVVEGDIAFDPTTGTLYAISSNGQLFTINTSNGHGIVIGILPGNLDESAMAFDSAGNLYMVDSFTQTLLKVNKTNATIISSLPMGNVGQEIGGLAFDPQTGILYFAGGYTYGSSLYTVNTTTGEATEGGPDGVAGGISGLTFTPGEPNPVRESSWGRVKQLYR